MDWVRRVDVVILTADRNIQKLDRGLQFKISLQYLLEYHRVVITTWWNVSCTPWFAFIFQRGCLWKQLHHLRKQHVTGTVRHTALQLINYQIFFFWAFLAPSLFRYSGLPSFCESVCSRKTSLYIQTIKNMHPTNTQHWAESFYSQSEVHLVSVSWV